MQERLDRIKEMENVDAVACECTMTVLGCKEKEGKMVKYSSLI